jgi:uncharacterized protein involved in exopolysaccharide biosynthesis
MMAYSTHSKAAKMKQTIHNNNQDFDERRGRGISETITSRPRLILGITGLVTLCAIIYAFWIAKPVYEAQARIQLGTINGGEVEPLESIREKLTYTYDIYSPRLYKKLPILSSVDISRQDRAILTLVAVGRNNEEAKRVLTDEIDRLIKRENSIVKQGREAFEESLSKSESQLRDAIEEIKETRASIDNYRKKIAELKKEDVALLGSYLLEIWKLRDQIEKNQMWRGTVSNYIEHKKLQLIDTKPPKLIETIVTHNRPAKPRKILIVAIGFVSGLLLSLLLVLFLDFLREQRRSKR